MQDVLIVAELGPNPAPLAELIWALHRQRSQRVCAVFLLVTPRTLAWFQREFLAPGGALDQLQQVLGRDLLSADSIHTEAVEDGGTLLRDDAHHTARWNDARWRLYRRAIQAAGARPVIFGLIGGSHRTRAATTAVMFQLLARPQDCCLDVRVDNDAIKGGTGFYFPEQPDRPLRIRSPMRGGQPRSVLVEPASVTVRLVPLELPLLRGLLPPQARESWGEALTATQVALRQAERPRLDIDLVAERATVNGTQVLPLSLSQLIWLAALAWSRKQGTGWIDAADHRALRQVLQHVQPGAVWIPRRHNKALRGLRADPAHVPDEGSMRTLRAQTRSALRKASQPLPHGSLLVPEIRSQWHDGAKETAQRLPLEGERIGLRLCNVTTID